MAVKWESVNARPDFQRDARLDVALRELFSLSMPPELLTVEDFRRWLLRHGLDVVIR